MSAIFVYRWVKRSVFRGVPREFEAVLWDRFDDKALQISQTSKYITRILNCHTERYLQ